MWLDESLNSFFRRLCFTPDGSFLIVPSKLDTPPSYLVCLLTPYLPISAQVGGQKLEKRPKTLPISLLEVTSQSMCILSQTVSTHTHTCTYKSYILSLSLPTFSPDRYFSCLAQRSRLCACDVVQSCLNFFHRPTEHFSSPSMPA